MNKEKKIRKSFCKECGNEFTPFNTMDKYCSMPCRYEGAKKIIEANRKKKVLQAKREKAKWKREGLDKLKSKRTWEDELQKEINQIVRLIDGKFRIDGARAGKIDAGHYVARGSNATIRYNLHNIHNQSVHSNRWKSGDTIKYQDGLKKTYGLEYFEMVESLRQTPPIKLSIETIREKISIAKAIVRELKELANNYDAKERIALREELNFRIGIYLN